MAPINQNDEKFSNPKNGTFSENRSKIFFQKFQNFGENQVDTNGKHNSKQF